MYWIHQTQPQYDHRRDTMHVTMHREHHNEPSNLCHGTHTQYKMQKLTRQRRNGTSISSVPWNIYRVVMSIEQQQR